MSTKWRVCRWHLSIVAFFAIFVCVVPDLYAQRTRTSGARARAARRAARDSVERNGWFFAVSGDSRDCGDLIMPKLAKSIESRRAQAPVKFYWHLGDFRALYRIDCDMAKRANPDFSCMPTERRQSEISAAQKRNYLETAWQDFIRNQMTPFERSRIPIFLGIGNHELGTFRLGDGVEKTFTRDDYRRTFSTWLTQPPLDAQRRADTRNGIASLRGDTYYHFIQGGVDFIYLDNADPSVGFSDEQIKWLTKVLARDGADSSVKTIIVGMHAALPHSISRGHAMDASCPSYCSGMKVYDLLQKAQRLDGAASARKHVYVMASHSHYFEENIYDTPEHKNKVLPGWIIGTAGAEQYRDKIRYGYLQVRVRPEGTLDTEFVDVKRDSPPLAEGVGAQQLTDFCFTHNKKHSTDRIAQGCACQPTP